MTIEEDTYGFTPAFIKLYEITTSMPNIADNYYQGTYTPTTVTYTMSNAVINQVNTITFPSFDFTNGNSVVMLVFELDQTFFPDIGR